MKIAILGAGAMGSLFGAILAEGGHEVWLLNRWKEHVDAINAHGLHILGVSGERWVRNLRATTLAAQVGPSDLVLVFVKSTVTEVAVSQSRALFGPHTVALTLQNGLGNVEKMASVLDKSQIIAGITAQGSTLLGPGEIRHAGTGGTFIGELDGTISPRIQAVAEAFNRSGIETQITDNVPGLIWGKLLVNVGINALTGLTGLKNGQLLDFPETEELLEMAVQEGFRIAQARGIQIPYADPVSHTKEIARATAGNRSSMLQDVMNRKKTEIGMINGAIVREAMGLGMEASVNRLLMNLVTVLEKTYQ